MPTVTVSPGGEATTTLNVRNDSDIVEAYTFTVVGECAAWTTVEPARVSLYPGTSETVTVKLAPPRSPDVRAGEKPLGVRVLPVEHPENVVVPETTVRVEAFRELQKELRPRRRRGWRGGRYRLALRNLGNTPVSLAPTGRQAGEELTLKATPSRRRLEPGESAEIGLKASVRSLIWFGEPVSWPFEIEVADADTEAGASPKTDGAPDDVPAPPAEVPAVVEGEFVQLPILPKWLLILLAILMALLVAWFALVRPAVRSAAKEAATAAQKEETAKQQEAEKAKPKPTPAPGGEQGSGGQGDGGSGGSGSGSGSGGTGGGQQSSATIDIKTGTGAKKVGTYQVPAGKVFGITDVVVANFQGDEGIITFSFGDRKITTIALETFRNQDYHWVTPIEIPENATVTAEVTCAKPGTPATGKQASDCHEVLNVSGVLRDLRP
ncbi:hydrolytic protein [Streptomyces sp. NPDC047981]|uniref:COG1470 family protein n=1 Tax=Streptomyces sp. NPDC047981 TaxID=3154610 RepID=UPI00343E86DE